jgi:hypothetical protein
MQRRAPTRLVRVVGLFLGMAGAASVFAACTWSSDCGINKITTESLPDATVGQVYSFALKHNCSGKEAASWSVPDGTLPPGLTLSYDGRIAGTPTHAGRWFFQVSISLTTRDWGGVTYSSGSDSRGYSLVVRP